MAFTTDKQTLDDLNLLGKPGSSSVYELFNRCETTGGALLLEDIFNSPFDNADKINKRAGIIRFFAEQKQTFPFSALHFGAIEVYLANNDERTRLSYTYVSFRSKLNRLIGSDIETVQIEKGIQAVQALLEEVRLFLDDPKYSDQGFLLEEYQEIRSLYAQIAGEKDRILADKQKKLIRIQLDSLFRFSFREILLSLLQRLYVLDVYIAVAHVAIENGFGFAEAVQADYSELILEEVFHPMIKAPVKNSLQVNRNGNVIFLTGANMAGKSTFMKTIGIAIMLGHMGLPVPAANMRFTVLDGMYTTINLPDDLASGASHFYAEVLRVKKVSRQLAAGKHLFVAFDELFRGTNVKDAYEATIAVTTGFARQPRGIFLVSTHIMEAADKLKEACNNICFKYLPTIMMGNTPVYTYQLHPGVTDDRHGMIIINNEGILDILR